jgi:hypothetical protein
VAFMSSCALYTSYNYMYYSLMGRIRHALYSQICYIEVSFKAGLTVLFCVSN